MATRPLALAISGKYAYAATFSRGVYASSDGGRSWREPATPPRSYAQTLAIAPSDPALVYAGFVGSNARGLYKSTDAGRTWQHLTDGLEDTDIYAVALDPTHPTTIYIGTGGGGVFKSTRRRRQLAAGKLGDCRGPGRRHSPPPVRPRRSRRPWGSPLSRSIPQYPTTLYAATSGKRQSSEAPTPDRVLGSPSTPASPVLGVKSLAIDATGRTLYAGSAGGGVVALHVSPEEWEAARLEAAAQRRSGS